MGIYNIYGNQISGDSGTDSVGIAGAVGDGITDDTKALTTALSQSNAVVDGGNKKYKYMSIEISGVENLTVHGKALTATVILRSGLMASVCVNGRMNPVMKFGVRIFGLRTVCSGIFGITLLSTTADRRTLQDRLFCLVVFTIFTFTTISSRRSKAMLASIGTVTRKMVMQKLQITHST